MERMMGVEPTLSAWEAEVLPINYIRSYHFLIALYHNYPENSTVNFKRFSFSYLHCLCP